VNLDIFEGDLSLWGVGHHIYFHAPSLEIARIYAKIAEQFALLAFDSQF